jgi:hypothetical protein
MEKIAQITAFFMSFDHSRDALMQPTSLQGFGYGDVVHQFKICFELLKIAEKRQISPHKTQVN